MRVSRAERRTRRLILAVILIAAGSSLGRLSQQNFVRAGAGIPDPRRDNAREPRARVFSGGGEPGNKERSIRQQFAATSLPPGRP